MKMATLVLMFAAIVFTYFITTYQAFTGRVTFDIDLYISQLIESGELDVSTETTSLLLNDKELMHLREKCLN